MNLDSENVILSILLDNGLSKELLLSYHYKAPQNRIYLKPSRCYSLGPGRPGRATTATATLNPFSLSVETNGDSDEDKTLGQDA